MLSSERLASMLGCWRVLTSVDPGHEPVSNTLLVRPGMTLRCFAWVLRYAPAESISLGLRAGDEPEARPSKEAASMSSVCTVACAFGMPADMMVDRLRRISSLGMVGASSGILAEKVVIVLASRIMLVLGKVCFDHNPIPIDAELDAHPHITNRRLELKSGNPWAILAHS